MIEINIIKSQLTRLNRKRVVFHLFLIYFAGLVFLLGFFLIVILSNRSFIKSTRNEIENIQLKITENKEIFDYIKEKETEFQYFSKGINLFISERKNRIEWAPILAFIGAKVPSGVWIDKFATKEDKSRDKTRENTAILISGYVLKSTVNERDAVDRLVRNLNTGRMFSGVYLKEIKATQIQDAKVLFFNIECQIPMKKENKNVSEATD